MAQATTVQQGVFRFLNKASSSVTVLTAQVNVPLKIEEADWMLTLRQCLTLRDEKSGIKSYAAAFDLVQDQKDVIFSGWMFSVMPSVSYLDHQTYDLVLQECH